MSKWTDGRMRAKIKSIVFNLHFIFLLYSALAVVGSLGQYFKGPQFFNDQAYTHYNNFVIFRQSFFHLRQEKDLYALYPDQYWDYYKYSPSFALFMAPFALFPDWLGLILWNLVNCLLLFFAVRKMDDLELKQKWWLLLFISLELFTSVQNAQSNGLLTAFLLLAFSAFNTKKISLAALFIVVSFYVKIFGIAALILFLLYPRKIKFLLLSAGWFILLGILPLLFISPPQLVNLYRSWINLLLMDQAVSQGLLLMGILHRWFSIQLPKVLILSAGVIFLVLPLLRFRTNIPENFKLNYLASLLIWMVIFNHKAESPTYILAMTGVGLWFFSNTQNHPHLILTILAFILTSLSPTDLFPRMLRDHFLIPYQLKALPVVLIWLKIQWDLFSRTIYPTPQPERTKEKERE